VVYLFPVGGAIARADESEMLFAAGNWHGPSRLARELLRSAKSKIIGFHSARHSIVVHRALLVREKGPNCNARRIARNPARGINALAASRAITAWRSSFAALCSAVREGRVKVSRP